jgi:hypothetical protein
MSITTTLARLARMPAQELLGELAGALAVEHADDREDQQPLADLEDRGRELADRLLLLADDALALADEVAGHDVGDAVGRRLVGVEHAVEEREVRLVLLEQRAGQHVAQEQHDRDDLVDLDPTGDDALGEVARVVLQRLGRAGLQHLDVVVVDRRRLVEDLLLRQRGQQLRLRDPAGPLLAQLRPVRAQVGDELAEEPLRRLAVTVARRRLGGRSAIALLWGVCGASRSGPSARYGHVVAQPAHRGVHDRLLDRSATASGRSPPHVCSSSISCSVPNTSRRWRRDLGDAVGVEDEHVAVSSSTTRRRAAARRRSRAACRAGRPPRRCRRVHDERQRMAAAGQLEPTWPGTTCM